MKGKSTGIFVIALATISISCISLPAAQEIMRPEDIKSKRQIIYDDSTYVRLANLWKEYYDRFPSEYAYANWMYASRYAEMKYYAEMLDKGLEKYPANPTLLYLEGLKAQGIKYHDEAMTKEYYERAAALDPNYMDPWFTLIPEYMKANDEQRTDLALRRILSSGVISDEIMDYNYNLLISLDKDAILVTNGDNDTYPGWILTRILKVRPDILIVNRSLLNTDWYPVYLTGHGAPYFINQDDLESMRNSVLKKMGKDNTLIGVGGPFGDTLVALVIESATRAGRPVYFSKTLFIDEKLESIIKRGRDLGLMTLVTDTGISYSKQIREAYGKWIKEFRTGGMDSWRLRAASPADAGKMLISVNYTDAITCNIDTLKVYAPELREGLFRWYSDHLQPLLSAELMDKAVKAWCRQSDDANIRRWCERQGIKP